MKKKVLSNDLGTQPTGMGIAMWSNLFFKKAATFKRSFDGE